MLKFEENDKNVNILENGGTYNKPIRHKPLKEMVDLSIKKGPVVDKRLTIQLNQFFTKEYLPISIIKLLGVRMFRCGKKRKAENMVGAAMQKLKDKDIDAPLEAFHKAIEIVRFPAALRVYKKGRKTIFIPYLMRPEAAYYMAARIILSLSRYNRSENGMVLSLAAEIHDILNGKGLSLTYKEKFLEKIAENYSSYRQIRKFRRKRGQFRK
jgi:small subunit ribosomal protein S7